MRPTVLIIFMLVVTSLLPMVATSDRSTEALTLGDRPDGWWMGYHRDGDLNGVDDLLDRAHLGDGDTFPLVLAALDRIPADDDVEWLRDRGFEVVYAARNFETIVLGNVDSDDLPSLVKLDGLLLLEVPPELEYMLDVAVPSLKVRESTEYSPYTAWELGYDGDGQNIAIMDSGVNDQIPIGHSMVDDMDDDPATYDPKHIAGVDAITGVIVGGAAVNPEDSDSAHGTHVAGDALGTGTTHQGPAPGARLIDIRVGSLTNLNLAAVLGAIDWCIDNNETDWEDDGPDNDGVPVLSMSFGGAASNGNDQMSQAVNDAVEAGIVCVVAAGNNGPNNNGLSQPGSADRSINIASYDDHNTVTRGDDTISGFSARGPRDSDGDSDVYDEMKPHVAAVGTGVTSALAWTGYLLASTDGTSMATPEVSGLIALMLEANPSLRPGAPRYELDIKRILADTAQDRAGADRPQYSEKWDRAWGYGQVDGYGAVKRAEDLTMTALDGPGQVDTGTEDVTFEATLPVTRTPFTIEDDETEVRITIPDDWGKPTNIRISSDGGVDHTTSNTDPTSSGGYWTFDATLTHTEDIDHYQECTVSVEFDSDAPSVDLPTDYDMEARAWTNGVRAYNADHTIRVVPVPNIVYNAHTVDDDNLGSSSGNGDEVVNPGEVIELNVQARNVGSQTALDLQGELSSTSTYVNITDDSEGYGNVAAGQTAWSLSDYDFRVSSSAPVGENLSFRLDFEDSAGHTWSDDFEVEVGGTEHDIAVVDVDAPARAEVDEEVTVSITLENLGLRDETDIEVRLVHDGLTEDSTTVDIDSGEQVDVELVWSSDEAGEFELTARSEPVTGEDAEDNNELNFTITVYTDKGRLLVDDVYGDPSDHGDMLALLADEGYRIANGSEFGIDLAEMLRSRLVVIADPGPLDRDHILELRDYVRLGGGVLMLADEDPDSFEALTGPMGLNWSTVPGTLNDTTHTVWTHPVTDNVTSLYLRSPSASLTVSDATLLFNSTNGANLSAAVEYGEGAIVVVSDDDFLADGDIEREDNALFPLNAAAWLSRATRMDDVGVARLSVPGIVRPNETFEVGITLINLGTANASDVDVRIDHAGNSTVKNVTSLPSRGWENLTFDISIGEEGRFRIVGSTPAGDDTPDNDGDRTAMDVFNGSGEVAIHTYHGNMSDHGDFLGHLIDLGFEISEIDTELRYEDVADVDELVLLDPANMEDEEIAAVHDFVRAGRGLLIVSDGPVSANLLAHELGITWSSWPGREGTTENIEQNDATEGVDALYLRRPYAHLSGPALFYDYPEEEEDRTLQGALAEYGEGVAFATSDIGLFADDNLEEEDNRRFGRQIVRHLIRDPVEHDGAVVNLTFAPFVERNETATVGATVHNVGLETDLFNVTLLVDDEEENSTQVSLLPGEYDDVLIDFVPMSNGTYNLSIVLEPVDGETALDNNRLNGTFSVLKVLLLDDCESDTGWDPESIWGISDARSRSGGSSWRYGSDADGNYSSGSGDASLSREFSLISIRQGVLTFRYFLDMEGDTAEVNVSTDDGESWETLAVLSGLVGRWDTATVSLSELEGFNATISFHVLHDGEDDDGEGLFLDDITIAGFVNVSRVTEVLAPEEGEFVSGVDEVLVHARDSDGIVNVTWKVDDGEWEEMELKEGSDSDGVWNATLNTSLLADGNHTIHARSTNSTGNVTGVNVTFAIDNTPPVINITEPEEDQHVGFITPVNFTAEDGTSGVESSDIKLPDGTWTGSGGHEDWDTRSVADGDHVIRVRAYDRAGNRGDAYRNVTVDNTPPSMEFVTPTEDEEVNGTIAVAAVATDATGVDSLEYRVAGDWTPMNLTSGDSTNGTWEMDWDTREVEDGDVLIEIRGIDPLGNQASIDIEVYVNNIDNPPGVRFLSPEDSDLVSGTVNIAVNASDDEGVAGVEYRIDEGAWQEMTEDDDHWRDDWYSPDVEDGVHDIHVRGTDTQNQTTTVTINVTVDNTPPGIVILGPNGSVKEIIRIRADISDEHSDEAWFRVDSGDWTNMKEDDPWYANIDTATYDDGEHTISIRASDGAGNINQTSWDLDFDNTWPEVGILHPDHDDTVSGTVSVRADINETNVDRVQFKTTGGWSNMKLNGSEYTYEWDSTETSDGEVTLKVRCRDLAGNEGYGSIDVSVDNVNDLPVITIVRPDDRLYGDEVEVRVRVEDDRGVDSVSFRPEDGSWTDMEEGTDDEYTYQWETDGLNGVIGFTVRAEDSDGGSRQASGNVEVDTAPPVLVDLEPVNGSAFEERINLTVTVDEDHLARVQIRIGSESWKNMKELDGVFYHDWDPKTDGSYLVKIKANDTVDNEVLEAFTYYRDSKYPSISVLDMPDPLTGYVKLKVDVVDDTLVSVEYQVDDDDWEEMEFRAYDRWTAMWNSGSVTDGAHTISFRATDAIGHVTERTVDVSTNNDNDLPRIWIDDPTGGVFAGDIPVQVTVRDDFGIETVEASIDRGDWMELWKSQGGSKASIWRGDVDTRETDDGPVTLEFRVTDTNGTYNETDVTVEVDNTAPDIRVKTPDEGDSVQDIVTVKVRAIEPNIKEVSAYLVSEWEDMEQDGETWSIEWDTTVLPEGEHPIDVRARDKLGNEAFKTWIVEIDNVNEDPTVVLLTPSSGTVTGTIDVTARVVDDRTLDTVELLLGEFTEEMEYEGDDVYSYQFDTTSLDDAEYTLRVRATDIEGAVGADISLIDVDNEEDPIFAPTISVDGRNSDRSRSDMTFRVVVGNMGNRESTISLSAESDPGINVTFDSAEVTLDPEDDTRVTVTVRPIEPGTYTIRIYAEDHGESEYATLNVVVPKETSDETDLGELLVPVAVMLAVVFLIAIYLGYVPITIGRKR